MITKFDKFVNETSKKPTFFYGFEDSDGNQIKLSKKKQKEVTKKMSSGTYSKQNHLPTLPSITKNK